jgi:phosphonate transport system substrate-binding protein
LSYGRVGTPEEIKTAKEILGNLIWGTFRPSDDNQLLPIRILEANKSIMKINADDKLSAEEKAPKLAELQAKLKKYQEQSEKAEHSPFSKKLALFLDADKANNQAELKKLIGEFAANAANPPTN